MSRKQALGHHRDEDLFLSHLLQTGGLDANGFSRLSRTREETRETPCKLISKLGLLDERQLAERAAAFLNLPVLERGDFPSEAVLPDLLNKDFLKAEGLLPVRLENGTLIVATADPFSDYNRKAVVLACQMPVAFVVATASAIEDTVKQLYEQTEDRSAETGAFVRNDGVFEEDLQRLKDLATEAPVIRYVNHLMQDAVEKRASDIHIEPFHNALRVRFRIDGLLREIPVPSVLLTAAIVSRVKLLGRLNIAERRLPQDGRIRTIIKGKSMDVRVSTVPTLHGESVVLRLLDKSAISFEFSELGFREEDLARYFEILSNPNGIILVTGPTGSGKTTTLYASLLRLNKVETKILTVEDPVEYELPGINQIQVKPQIGLDFANALRSLVRQDPDIILIGEIRDLETAEIASQSALTGHRVLSTLHTNDAASSTTRLLDIGLPSFLIAATLRGIVAQRLVRRLCQTCKVETAAPPEVFKALKRLRQGSRATVFQPRGCTLCEGTGYRGRIGLYEVLAVTDQIRSMIMSNAQAPDIQAEAEAAGMTLLFEDGLQKACLGLTSVAEVLRATREA